MFIIQGISFPYCTFFSPWQNSLVEVINQSTILAEENNAVVVQSRKQYEEQTPYLSTVAISFCWMKMNSSLYFPVVISINIFPRLFLSSGNSTKMQYNMVATLLLNNLPKSHRTTNISVFLPIFCGWREKVKLQEATVCFPPHSHHLHVGSGLWAKVCLQDISIMFSDYSVLVQRSVEMCVGAGC